MIRWYAVNTQPRQEARAEANLLRQGFDVWLPLARRPRRHARRIDSVLTPLFPGYLFVHIDVETQRWRSIAGTYGVMRLLSQGEAPVPVPDRLVDEIMKRRDETGAVVVTPAHLVAGQAVRVVDGPLAEMEGLFQQAAGSDRAILLLRLLGGAVRATVPLAKLAA